MINGNLVLGKGELHLNLFAPGTKAGDGERYLGNTPGFTLTMNEESLERKGVRKGLKHLSDRYVVGRELVGTMICDQISQLNLALWLGSESAKETVAASGGATIEETMVVTRGLGYQLGTFAHPLGHRNVTNVVILKAGVPVTQNGNIVLDAAHGRFTVVDGAPAIPSGTELEIQYKTAGYSRTAMQSQRELKGALRYIAYNVYGQNTDMFFPYVAIVPDGSFDVKTADWQRIQFNISVMQMMGRELFYAGNLG